MRRLGARTLERFPDLFYPLCIVTGDKRETTGHLMTAGDLGVYSSTPADLRWIAGLGLRSDVKIHSDKNFVLLDEAELIKRFAETNILVIGSAAANHLARRVNRGAVFRFNHSEEATRYIDQCVYAAREREGLDRHLEELEKKGVVGRTLKQNMRSLFAGGIIDPTYQDDYVTASFNRFAPERQFDFGILTFAMNPFYDAVCKQRREPNDHKYVCIMAAGVHHPGTAHALRYLGTQERAEGVFESHPYGGVIRVELDLRVPFADRVELAKARWEDECDPDREPPPDPKQSILDGLDVIHAALSREPQGERKRQRLRGIVMSSVDAKNSAALLRAL